MYHSEPAALQGLQIGRHVFGAAGLEGYNLAMLRALGLVLLVAGCAAAQAQNAPDFAAINRIGKTAFDQNRAPGFSLAVWYKGQVLFANGFGYADVANKTPVTADTRFPVGSITRQFTAASTLLLAERGRLSLDESLGRFLPDMPNASRITLRMLLDQTSGLHNFPLTSEHAWPLEGQIDPARLFAILKTDRPDFAPGEQWEDSNTNYAALAAVVAKSSGMSFEQFVRQNIFAPLGMSASGVGYRAQQGTATPYEGAAGNFDPVLVPLSLDLFYGAGDIVSSANDLVRWDAALIGGRLLKPASMRDLWTPGKLTNGQPVDYAMGFVPASIGAHREMWQNGYTPLVGGYCLNAIFPDDQLAVVVLSNSPDAVFRGVPEQIVRDIAAMMGTRASAPQQVAGAPRQVTRAPQQVVGVLGAEDTHTQALARMMFEEIAAGKVDRSILSPAMNAFLTRAQLTQSARQFAALGHLVQMNLKQSTTLGNGVYYVYQAAFTRGVRQVLISVTSDDKVNGFQVVP